MFVTAEEANEKKCVLPIHVEGVRPNCIGPGCMAWRQEMRHTNSYGFEKKETNKGYCGLVNKS